MDGSRRGVVLVYPIQGFSGNFVKHAPISLLYASIDVVRRGFPVVIVDNRLHGENWPHPLGEHVTPETLVVGISVMSGTPIQNAVAVSKFVKALDPGITVVWGGPHATFYPDWILDEVPEADYVIGGYAIESFGRLVALLAERGGARLSPEDCGTVPGLAWRMNGARRQTAKAAAFEFVDYREIPYHLIPDYSVYGQLDQDRVIFSMYSVMGCPYQCSFCSSPAMYRDIKKKWQPLQAIDVVDHIEYVHRRYRASYIYFIDDDSFPNLRHVEGVIDELERRRLRVGLGFRGARISEILRMSDGFLEKLARAGTDIMHIGAESGSDRILTMLRKDCTADDIKRANRKLARHPQIKAAYNWMVGLPTETTDDLRATRDLMLAIVQDHPNAILFAPNTFRPLQGTALHEYVTTHPQWRYEGPRTVADWLRMEVEGGMRMPWVGDAEKRYADMLLVSSWFIDDKVLKTTSGATFLYRLLRLLHRLYKPIAMLRMRREITSFLIEYRLQLWLTGLFGRQRGGWTKRVQRLLDRFRRAANRTSPSEIVNRSRIQVTSP